MTGLNGGIYQITNNITGDRYIGQASDLCRRKANHFWALRNGRHFNRKLQNSFDKHGECAFLWTILERCPTKELNAREQWYLDTFSPEYNVAKCAEASARGAKRSPETRKKMSESLLKTVPFRNFRGATPGHAVSDETRAKMSAAKKGKKQSAEHVARRVASVARAKLDKKAKRDTLGVYE